jgi:hypothetical protein
MLIEQITGVARTQRELENYIICDEKDLPVLNDEVLNDDNNINQFQHDKAKYCRDKNVDKDTTNTEVEVESSFICFWLFYERFLEITEQLKVEHFTIIGAEKKSDAVASQFGNLEKELGELSRMKLNAKKNGLRFYLPN